MQRRDRTCWVILGLMVFFALDVTLALSFTFDAPKEVRPGEWFNITVNISSSEPVNVTTYSYVYRGLNCISQGWNVNQQDAAITGTQTVVLKDLVKINTEQGIYSIRVKVKFDNQTLNATNSIYVLATEKGSLMDIKESYLYVILIVISLVGIVLVFKYNR